jgi:membrane AbrB-like protein
MRTPRIAIDPVPLRRAILALAIGVVSALAATAINLPLPWMLGPMIGVTLAALLNAPIHAPAPLRPVVIPAIGVMLGSSITPEIVALIPRWSLSVAILLPFLVAAGGVSWVLYRKVGKYDPVTAYFSAMPGGLNDMLVMGAEAGGEERRIALAHALRIFCVIMVIVLFYGLVLGVSSEGQAGAWVALDALSVWDWVILLGCGVLGVPLGQRIRLPAAQVFGPMILSGAAHLTGIVTVAPPTIVILAAQLVIGTVVGCRFLGTAWRDVGRDMALGVGSSLAMLAVTVVFAVIASRLTGIPLTQTMIAFAPGGLAEMTLLSLAMGQDVAYVSVIHMIRLLVVIGTAGYVFRMIRR